MGIFTLLGQQLRRASGGTNHLAALPRTQFNVMNHGAHGNILQRQSVASHDIRFRTGNHMVPYFQALGIKDISLVAIGVAQQGDEDGAVRVILTVATRAGIAVLSRLKSMIR